MPKPIRWVLEKLGENFLAWGVFGGGLAAIYTVMHAIWSKLAWYELVGAACTFTSGWLIGAVLWFQRRSAKLIIHQAKWGIGDARYRDVTVMLRGHLKDNAINVPVMNSTFDCDPYEGVRKHLVVRYSFGRSSNKEIIRHETDQLILPEREDQVSSILGGTRFVTPPAEVQGKSWLDKVADDDAAKIRDRLLITDQHTIFHFEPGSDPYIEVMLMLLNTSVFEVVTLGHVEGQAMYGKHQLPIPVQVFDKTGPPGATFLSLKHGDSGILRIRQFLSVEVADRMWAERDRNIPIDFELVAIEFNRISGVVQRFDIYGPMVTINKATRNRVVA